MPRTCTTSSTKGKHIVHPAYVLPKGDACLACRARKVRCSGETPVCSSCIKHWKHEGKDVSLCTCEWSTKKGRGTRASRTMSGSSSDSSVSVNDSSSHDSDDAASPPTASPSPVASTSTSSWTAAEDSYHQRSTTTSELLVESYFTGVPLIEPPAASYFSLPPATAPTFPAYPSPGAYLAPEFDFSAFLASSFPFATQSNTPAVYQPPLITTPPHSPDELQHHFEFDSSVSSIDALDAIFDTGKESEWTGAWGRPEIFSPDVSLPAYVDAPAPLPFWAFP